MIDVLLICLNDEKNIKNMLESIKYSNFKKLIIVDGGSTDKTFEIAKEYTEFVYISEEGMAKQTKLGLNYVKSEYLFFILSTSPALIIPSSSLNAKICLFRVP